MEAPMQLLSWRFIPVAVIVYFGTLVSYRLLLHPLARFPGPRLAAVTRLYEAYFDVVLNGQYTFKIVQMHKEYGPIVRISPYELHVIDSTFFEKLYRQEGRWDKYAWAYNGFSANGATICTADHDLHKARRMPLSPFFSKTKVAQQQDLIRQKVEQLCKRISQFSTSKKAIDLGAATSAFTRDVSTDFILARNYKSLDHEDFNAGMTNVFQDSGHIWRITKHITWFGPTMKSIPIDWIMRVADEGTKSFFRYLQDSTKDTEALLTATASPSSNLDAKTRRTIVHEIMDSKLTPADKSFPRVFDDVATVTGAGFETTASVLRLIFYHVFSNAEILQRLRSELRPATTNDLKVLEQLPYLTSVLMEGMRLSPAIASRMARIAPDRELVYNGWHIPAGTPIGMTTLLMHTDEMLYPDPMQFNPDRWMDLDFRKKADKTYAPFSKGTRICLGMHLAWAEMYLVLPALVQQFNFQFDGTIAEDFVCESDQFIIGTKGKGSLKAFVTLNKI
ncbi:cytochrome P450 [Mollisia scopiformis]|uniref:Cytochrome P450 n=1 Tax=Mollisia scopiformis TaxID=149040 RepID=A0A194XEA6_MOLSC|nr:cytochrome P450 [Mollisia scopiformis]KUJ18476.1 cytochrome P450 [Mollisia scopiformis]